MNAAETSASSAIADCTPLAVVWRSLTTAEIETFINDVSKTRTNIAIARSTASFVPPCARSGTTAAASTLIRGGCRLAGSSHIIRSGGAANR